MVISQKIYKGCILSDYSNLRIVSMIPGNPKGSPDVYSLFSNFGGIF